MLSHSLKFDPMDEFPHKIQFQTHLVEDDGMGGQIDKGWEDVDKDNGNDGWSSAHVQPVSSNEYQQAGTNVNPIVMDIYFPYRTDILPDMRVLLEDGRTVEIKTRPIDQGGMQEICMIEVTGDELNDG
ncbi:phage head closure protein [Sporolactobacillus sp. KGMB 08714]|uniref:phage head closure protein n=1 Tax=Sporolactobacillus sp. KGMB 08714 TaxID=3064704 RepID=UPI002FBDD5F1